MSIMQRRRFIKGTVFATSAGFFPNIIIPRQKKELGVALVGLGYYSRDLLAPALQLTEHCKLVGIVTGSPHKIPVWQDKYGIKNGNVYNYENMDEIANNPDIDIIYIVLPTGLHAEYAIKAADTGKHVWCEKPMARTADECASIISACQKNQVKLAIGYRMQHEPNTQTIMSYAKSKPYGEIRKVISEAGYREGQSDHWKQNKAMGGGAMYDMGVYALQGARYTMGAEPIAVTASHSTTRPEIYHEVDETTSFKLEFPNGGVADCKTSFGEGINHLRATCEKGWYELRPMQSYSGAQGRTSDGILLNKTISNQQAKQMDDDALSIINDQPMMVPGEEGMRDIAIVESIYKSAALGSKRIVL